MSVIIKGMEMPRCCAECDAEGHYEDRYGDEYGFFCPFGYKAYTRETRELKRLDDCPLIPVPPHGRLIDADALTDAIESTDWYHQAPNKEMVHGANSAEHQAWYKEQDIYSVIDNAHTIIPSCEEVYDKYTDTAGNLHWTGTHSGKHIVPADKEEKK